MKTVLIIIAILVASTLQASFGYCVTYAIIDDVDGYTNVRVESESSSAVVHRLNENVVFQVVSREANGFVKVRIWGDKFGFHENYVDSQGVLNGYVHESRIKYLDDIEEYTGDGLSVEYEIQPFDSIGRVINREEGIWVTHIDGRRPLGVDGGLPRMQTDGINLVVDGRKLDVSEVFYRDLFNCLNKFNFRKVNDTYFVYQMNSDGVGSYEVVWAIDSKGIHQRVIQIYPC